MIMRCSYCSNNDVISWKEIVMITSTQYLIAERRAASSAPVPASAPAPQIMPQRPPDGVRETELWGEVLLRAIEDFKTYMA